MLLGKNSNANLFTLWARITHIPSDGVDRDTGGESGHRHSAVPDGKALLFARTQIGHHVSLLIGLANEGVR